MILCSQGASESMESPCVAFEPPSGGSFFVNDRELSLRVTKWETRRQACKSDAGAPRRFTA